MSGATQEAADWLDGVDEALAAGSDAVETSGGGIVEFDAASDETAAAFGEAIETLRGLQLAATLIPDDVAFFDAEVRSLCASLGKAFAARGRFLTAHRLLAGLAPDFPN